MNKIFTQEQFKIKEYVEKQNEIQRNRLPFAEELIIKITREVD